MPFPEGTPRYIIDTYQTRGKSVSTIATCAAGQRLERGITGYNYDTIVALIKGVN